MPVEGYFNDLSMIRRVHREHVVALSGPRALLMQAAHPVAFVGFFMSTGALDDPYARLQRTAAVLDAVTWRDRQAADRATARVRRIHARFGGELPEAIGRFPAGTPWRADDPDLLLWIVATLADSALLVYTRYVTGLSRGERDAYWEDFKVLGRLFGLSDADLPETSLDLEAYVLDMLASDVLYVSDTARELGIEIVMRPPVPLAARPLLELANYITVGLLPEPVRRGYGFGWDPLRAASVRVGAEYVKRLVVPVLPGRVRYIPDRAAAA